MPVWPRNSRSKMQSLERAINELGDPTTNYGHAGLVFMWMSCGVGCLTAVAITQTLSTLMA